MDFQYLKDKIYKDTQPKRINGKKMNGKILAGFIMEIVGSINSNAIPNINNSWDKVVMDDIINYKNKALNSFKNAVKKLTDSNNNNNNLKEKENLIKFLLGNKLDSMVLFNKILIVNSDIDKNKSYKESYLENKKILQKEIDKIIERLVSENDEKCGNFNGRIIRENYREVINLFFNFFNFTRLKKK